MGEVVKSSPKMKAARKKNYQPREVHISLNRGSQGVV